LLAYVYSVGNEQAQCCTLADWDLSVMPFCFNAYAQPVG
jgi:hypothetical protein